MFFVFLFFCFMAVFVKGVKTFYWQVFIWVSDRVFTPI